MSFDADSTAAGARRIAKAGISVADAGRLARGLALAFVPPAVRRELVEQQRTAGEAHMLGLTEEQAKSILAPHVIRSRETGQPLDWAEVRRDQIRQATGVQS